MAEGPRMRLADVAIHEPQTLPFCAKCQRPVERVEWTDDVLTRERRFKAFCHNEVETAILAEEVMYDLNGIPELPVFFAPDGLPAPEATTLTEASLLQAIDDAGLPPRHPLVAQAQRSLTGLVRL